MSTTQERINAQRGAYDASKHEWWGRHLISPDLLELLFGQEEKLLLIKDNGQLISELVNALAEAREYIDRFGQDGVRQRMDAAISKGRKTLFTPNEL